MISWGINAINHDASISVFEDGNLVFASHSERFSRQKNDAYLNNDIIAYALQYGYPERIAWSERPLLKKARQLITRDSRILTPHPKSYLKRFGINCKVDYISHHESHAAAAAYTSSTDKSLIFVFDGIGEFDTMSVWKYDQPTLVPVYKQGYPHSLGLFYSAFTRVLGLKPNEEEFILMGMAAYGQPIYKKQLLNRYFDLQYPSIKLKENVHLGTSFSFINAFDLAASVQAVYEEITYKFCEYFKNLYGYEHASFSGGCSLNCSANSKYSKLFKRVWVYPNSGDAGNSHGAGLAVLRTKQVYDPYIGFNIQRDIDIDQIVDRLKKGFVIGIANGKAEFGPRALGNRSLIADPRIKSMQENVNLIKRRERFRPFAPAILEEHFKEFFINGNAPQSRFMTSVYKSKSEYHYPGVTHKDGTSRVQTVSKNCNTVLRQILLEWYRETNIPILLNTSLNVKGQPLVNTEADALEFYNTTGIEVF